MKSCLFGNKMDIPLARLGTQIQINEIRNEKGGIATDITNI